MSQDKPCGLYRTTQPIDDDVQPGMLVYYHNHGDPGPGVYLPQDWVNNRAVFNETGTTIPDSKYEESLEPLLPEGLYRVSQDFFCCKDQCQRFEEDLLVQLGYNGDAEPILFVPAFVDGLLSFPDTGSIVEPWKLKQIIPLKVPEEKLEPSDLN
jgi:hypothetical protein